MKIRSFVIIAIVPIILICCGKKTFRIVNANNPEFIPNTAFSAFEDLSSPKFSALREKYQLDTVFHAEQDEFRRILLLRDWVRKVIQISDFESSYPGDDHAERILDHALQGQGYHCGHYKIVQNAVMNAYGYVTRCLGAGPGVKGGPDGHHGINEIWSNQYRKWFLSDAKYNHHFEKNGIPLSALEIRHEYLKNRAADIALVKGPDRTPIKSDGVANAEGEIVSISKEKFAQTYTWLEWEAANNRFTAWPDNEDEISTLNMYADDYFKSNTWIWNGKPHWAYGSKYMIMVTDRQAIEWTPNTISADVKIHGDNARIELNSNTPNLKTYQMKELPEGDWKDVPASVQIELKNAKKDMVFRTVNLANVAGAEHEVIIER